MREKAVLVKRPVTLAGVLSEPSDVQPDPRVPVVILLNAGIIHRVGPNRIYVKLARDLASLGFTVLRPDLSGIGDSDARTDNAPFSRRTVEEVQQAMDYLGTVASARRFILLGVCSGAEVAYRTACRDERVIGVAGVNGNYLDDSEFQSMHGRLRRRSRGRYYRKGLWDHRKWRRAITGRSDLRGMVRFAGGACRDLLFRAKRPSSQAVRGWNELARRGVDSLLVYSEGSTAFDVFALFLAPHLKNIMSPGRLTIRTIRDSDHVFTLLWSQTALIAAVRTWIQSGDRNWRRVPRVEHG